MCDSFHLPLVFLADNPGVLAGQASERAGILRAGARMFAAQTRAQTVKIHVTLRKAYGFGSSVMAMNPYDEQTLSFGFPGATLGAMGASGASNAVGADEATRAARRAKEGQADSITARDEMDRTRQAAPLVCPKGATLINTADHTLEEVIEKITHLIGS